MDNPMDDSETETMKNSLIQKVFARCDTLHDFVFDSRGDPAFFDTVQKRVKTALDLTALNSNKIIEELKKLDINNLTFNNLLSGKLPKPKNKNIQRKVIVSKPKRTPTRQSLRFVRIITLSDAIMPDATRSGIIKTGIQGFNAPNVGETAYILTEIDVDETNYDVFFAIGDGTNKKPKSTVVEKDIMKYSIHYNSHAYIWNQVVLQEKEGPYLDPTDYLRYYKTKYAEYNLSIVDETGTITRLIEGKDQIPFVFEEDKNEHTFYQYCRGDPDHIEMVWKYSVIDQPLMYEPINKVGKLINAEEYFTNIKPLKKEETEEHNELLFYKIEITWEEETVTSTNNKIRHYGCSYVCATDIDFTQHTVQYVDGSNVTSIRKCATITALYEKTENEHEDENEDSNADENIDADTFENMDVDVPIKLKDDGQVYLEKVTYPSYFIRKLTQNKNTRFKFSESLGFFEFNNMQFKRTDYITNRIILDPFNYRNATFSGGWVVGNDKFNIVQSEKPEQAYFNNEAIKMMSTIQPTIPDLTSFDKLHMYKYDANAVTPNQCISPVTCLASQTENPINSTPHPIVFSVNPSDMQHFVKNVIVPHFPGFAMCIDMTNNQISDHFPLILTTACVWDSSSASSTIKSTIVNGKRVLKEFSYLKGSPNDKNFVCIDSDKLEILSTDLTDVFFCIDNEKEKNFCNLPSIKMIGQVDVYTFPETKLSAISIQNRKHLQSLLNNVHHPVVVIKTVGLLKDIISKKLIHERIFPHYESTTQTIDYKCINECINIKRSGDALQVIRVNELCHKDPQIKTVLLTGDQLCFFQCLIKKTPAISHWCRYGIHHITLYNPLTPSPPIVEQTTKKKRSFDEITDEITDEIINKIPSEPSQSDLENKIKYKFKKFKNSSSTKDKNFKNFFSWLRDGLQEVKKQKHEGGDPKLHINKYKSEFNSLYEVFHIIPTEDVIIIKELKQETLIEFITEIEEQILTRQKVVKIYENYNSFSTFLEDIGIYSYEKNENQTKDQPTESEPTNYTFILDDEFIEDLQSISSLSHYNDFVYKMNEFKKNDTKKLSKVGEEIIQYALDRIALWGFDFGIVDKFLNIQTQIKSPSLQTVTSRIATPPPLVPVVAGGGLYSSLRFDKNMTSKLAMLNLLKKMHKKK